jgi:predicted Zn-dependent peptidase
LEFRQHKLANGLEIVAECNAQAFSTALGFYVETGARDEHDAIAGVSHFLEHMTFKGTPTRTADDVNREFDEMGADYNAFTSEEGTVYYAAVLPEFQHRATALLADVLRPTLPADEFDSEKQVILEEIFMHEDHPPFGAEEKCRAAHFGSHPLGRSILGTVESITALSVEAMRDYHGRRYGPDNVTLVGTGRIDFDALCRTAEECCGSWTPVGAVRAAPPVESNTDFGALEKPTATQQYAVQIADAPSATHPARFAAGLLATVLGDETGSRLYWELVDPGLAEHAVLGHLEYGDTGVYATHMSCAPELAGENLQRMLDLLRRVEAEGITEEELAQAKSKLSSRVVLSGERSLNRLSSVGTEWVLARQYRSVRDVLDEIAAVTVDDVSRVLRQFPPSRGTTVTIGPLAELAAPR